MNGKHNFLYLNETIVKEEGALVSAIQSGLFYGAGCFESFVADHDSVFRFSDHYRRLINGLNYLEVPDHLYPDRDSLRAEISKLLKKNNLNDDKARVRVQLSLDEKNGYETDENLKLIKIISCNKTDQISEPARLIMAKTKTVPGLCRPANLKLSNMLHYRAAYREAQRTGADDALMLNTEGFVAETSVANIFWIKGDVICTPSAGSDILPGIMRASVIRIIQEEAVYQVNEGKFYPEELKQAECVWITNSVKEIQPVHSINENRFNTIHPVIDTLKSGLEEMKSNESS